MLSQRVGHPETQGSRSGAVASAGAQDSQANDFIALEPDDDVVVGQLAIGGMGRLFEVHVQDIGLGVIGGPEVSVGGRHDAGGKREVVRGHYGGHSCLLRFSDASRRVTKAVMMNPSPSPSRYTTINAFPGSTVRGANNSPPGPSRTCSGCWTVSSTSSRSPACSSVMWIQRSFVSRMEMPCMTGRTDRAAQRQS